jgi:hypothetical protein
MKTILLVDDDKQLRVVLKHPTVALIDPIPFFHVYDSMLQRIERL